MMLQDISIVPDFGGLDDKIKGYNEPIRVGIKSFFGFYAIEYSKIEIIKKKNLFHEAVKNDKAFSQLKEMLDTDFDFIKIQIGKEKEESRADKGSAKFTDIFLMESIKTALKKAIKEREEEQKIKPIKEQLNAYQEQSLYKNLAQNFSPFYAFLKENIEGETDIFIIRLIIDILQFIRLKFWDDFSDDPENYLNKLFHTKR
jgi:hypothetical protein